MALALRLEHNGIIIIIIIIIRVQGFKGSRVSIGGTDLRTVWLYSLAAVGCLNSVSWYTLLQKFCRHAVLCHER